MGRNSKYQAYRDQEASFDEYVELSEVFKSSIELLNF